MRNFPHRLFGICTLTALSLALVGWLALWGMGIALELGELSRTLAAEERRAQALHEITQRALRRLERRDIATQDVIAGRRSLIEAAAEFRELAETFIACDWEWYRGQYPGASDEECHCREVMKYVRAKLDNEPDRAQVVLARLEAELQKHLVARGYQEPCPPR